MKSRLKFWKWFILGYVFGFSLINRNDAEWVKIIKKQRRRANEITSGV